MTKPEHGPQRPQDPNALDEIAELLRGALHREADAVRPTPEALDRILALARTAPVGTSPTGDGASHAHDGAPLIRDGVAAARGPATVELPAVGRPLDEPGTDHQRATDGQPVQEPPRTAGRVLHFAVGGGRRRGLAGWMPILSAAAAVAVLAGGLGAVRVGVIQAPGLVASAVGAKQAVRTDARAVIAAPQLPLPVYLVSRQQGRWALVREFTATTLSDPDERLAAALRLAVAGSGSDPDLTSVWASLDLKGEVAGQIDESHLTVRLSAGLVEARPAEENSETMDRAALARLAVDQLVWTATAVVGRDGPVRIETDADDSPALFDVLPLGRAYSRAYGQSDPRAPVWISTVADGQRFGRGNAIIGGDATTTQSGTVEWTLTGPEGTTVATGSQRLTREDGMATRTGERGNFQLHLLMPDAGIYRLTVTQRWLWPSSGSSTSAAWAETKTLQVA
jgi:hypothetical protein